jgi:four helix bundle protein
MQDFRKLLVWQRAQQLSSDLDALVDRVAARKPGLADQIDRSANAISANIAEACGRHTPADKRRILAIGIGEANELESHLIRARNAALMTVDEAERFIDEVTRIRKMLFALRSKMQ